MDRELKIKIIGLIGSFTVWRTWNYINYIIDYPESDKGDLLTIGIPITVLILLTTIIMVTKRSQFARRAIQLIFIFFILTKISSYFVLPSGISPTDIYTTNDFIRHGLIITFYGYIIYFFQTKDITNFLDKEKQQTV